MTKKHTKVRRVPEDRRELMAALELVEWANWRAVDEELSRESRRVAMEEDR